MSVRKWMFAGALLLAAGLSSLGFAQKPGLKFNPDKKFKIVQFTDLHVKWQDPRSDIAFERMNQVLDDEKPDLVIFTGDIIYSKPALENMRNVLKTVSDRKIPFSIVFGNHDNEQGATKEELLKVAESLPYSLTADEVPEISGVGNYALTVRSSDGKKDAFVLYCIDANTYSTIKGVKGYDYIKNNTPETVAPYLTPSFSGTSEKSAAAALKSYIEIDAWCSTPVFTESAYIKLQDVMQNAGFLESRVTFTSAVDNTFAKAVAAEFTETK